MLFKVSVVVAVAIAIATIIFTAATLIIVEQNSLLHA